MGNIGSYLTIVNDTSDLWVCKIGVDESALTIFNIVTGVITGVAAAITAMGATAPFLSWAVANGIVSIFGISTRAASALATFAKGLTGVKYITGTAGVALSVTKTAIHFAYQNGYAPIPPGQSYRWGKMSLSFWQQGHCKRYIVTGSNSYYSDELYMRPIFSGSTDNSNLDHKILFWINKVGTTNKLSVNIPTNNKASTSALSKSSLDAISPLEDNTNSSTPFICNICGNGLSILQPDSMTYIPGYGNLTCGFIDREGKNGNITREQCPLVSQFLTPCGCSVPPKRSKRERGKKIIGS
jgi:hypothetical protein